MGTASAQHLGVFDSTTGESHRLGANLLGEGTWPEGYERTTDRSKGIPVWLQSDVVCMSLQFERSGGLADEYRVACWDQRLPAGEQLIIIGNSTNADGLVAMGAGYRMCMAAEVDPAAGKEYYCVDMATPASTHTAFLVGDLLPGTGGSASSNDKHYPQPAGSDHMCMPYQAEAGSDSQMGCYQWSTGIFTTTGTYLSTYGLYDADGVYRNQVGDHFTFPCAHGFGP